MTERNVRRRLYSKSPAPTALVAVSTTSHLPASCQQQVGRRAPGSFGHYNVLGVERTATAEQVRHAYRRKALEVHPDKLSSNLGREPTADELSEAEKFYCCVVNAFEVLSDPRRREEYDALFAPEDGTFSAAASSCADPRGAAADSSKDPLGEARLLVQDAHSEGRTIDASQLSTSVLFAMRSYLRGERRIHTQEEPQQSKGPGSQPASKKKLDPCLRAKGHGYEVSMQWASMMVITSVTGSLEEAVAWRAALTLLRGRAQSRMREMEAQGKEAPPILKEEIRDVLRMEPDIPISFVCRFKLGPTPVEIPRTQNLELALSLRSSLQQFRTASRMLERMQAKARKAVDRDKQQCKKYCTDLLKAVARELDQRLPLLEQQAALAGHYQQQLRSMESRLAVASELRTLLGLETADAASSALALLRQLHPDERSRRMKALLRPARALPAPRPAPKASPPAASSTPALPAPPKAPREREAVASPVRAPKALAPKPPAPLPSGNAGLLKVTPRPEQRPLRVRPRLRLTRGPAPEAQEFLPRKLVERALQYLDCMELDCFRAAAPAEHAIGDKVYWDRCRVFSCPSEFVGGVRFSSRGRRLARKGNTALSLTVAFLAQPWLRGYFEHLKFRVAGAELLESERLLAALSQMPHVTVVELPASGWDSLTSKIRLQRSLQLRDIDVQ